MRIPEGALGLINATAELRKWSPGAPDPVSMELCVRPPFVG
jgi:hypothetical protein